MKDSFIIEPGTFQSFENDAELIGKCKEWGLLSEKAAKSKPFFYKGNGMNETCRIVGFVDKMTAVIEFENNKRHCIHPSYLKEMQASTYGQRTSLAAEDGVETAEQTDASAKDQPAATAVIEQDAELTAEAAETVPAGKEPAKAKGKKEKAAKLELPEDKVKMTATVKEFTTVPNHFSDTDDEVVIYEGVSISDPALEIGDAWSSYSNTLKKLELEAGDVISFEGKIVAKKLTKHPVPYKINNPGKLQKIE
jgi:hypothetical protein